jgi:hypothetical protein
LGVGIQQPQPFDVRFPLRLDDFRTENGYRVLDFHAEGVWFSAAIRMPPNVSVADLNAAAAVVSSIRFPQLHEGTPAPSGYFVAGRASSYRPGSVFTGTATTATCASIAATARSSAPTAPSGTSTAASSATPIPRAIRTSRSLA